MKSEPVGATFTTPIRVEVREPQHVVAEGAPVPDTATVVGADWRRAAIAARGQLSQFHILVVADVWREVICNID